MATVVTRARRGTLQLRVEWNHIINSFASPLLYLTPLTPIGDDGIAIDPFTETATLHILVVANQPAELQIETVLSSLAQLISRQEHLARLKEKDASFATLEADTAQADVAGEAEAIDTLRYGWRATAEQIARKAEQAGLGLEVSFEPAFASMATELKPRLPLLRRVYNEMDDVRALIDRMVAAIAARDSRVAGGSESTRMFLQQRGSLMSMSQYFAQAVRDALVLGNGYVQFTEAEPLGAFNLRPEASEPPSSKHAVHLIRKKGSRSPLHFTGFEQPHTAVGLGVCELMLRDLRTRDVVNDAIDDMKRFAPTHREAADKVREYAELAAEQDRSRRGRVTELFGWWMDNAPEPPTDLYFDGQNLM